MTSPVPNSPQELADALRTIRSLIGKLMKVQTRLRKGTAQHSLTKNRLKAFRIAAALVKKAMRK